jgi:hypothetical protein
MNEIPNASAVCCHLTAKLKHFQNREMMDFTFIVIQHKMIKLNIKNIPMMQYHDPNAEIMATSAEHC